MNSLYFEGFISLKFINYIFILNYMEIQTETSVKTNNIIFVRKYIFDNCIGGYKLNKT